MGKKRLKEMKTLFFKRAVFVFLIMFLIVSLLSGVSNIVGSESNIFSSFQGFVKGIFETSRFADEGRANLDGVQEPTQNQRVLDKQEIEGERTLMAPGNVVAVLNASRTSCVAPCAVFFDATGTTATTTSRPFHELDYSWDFGDPSSGNWWNGNSKNSAKGGVAAHVFETPGTFTVRLDVRDVGGNSDTKSVVINVEDADVRFSGTNTTCFAKDNLDWNGCPVGANRVVSSDASLVGDINSRIASGRRLLLRRGDSWSATANINIGANGPGMIGAFGTCSNPNQQGICANAPHIIGRGVYFSGSPQDWRIIDLHFSDNIAIKGIETEGDVQNLLFLRMNIQNFDYGALIIDPTTGYDFSQTDIAIADSLIYNNVNYGVYMGGVRLLCWEII